MVILDEPGRKTLLPPPPDTSPDPIEIDPFDNEESSGWAAIRETAAETWRPTGEES